MFRSGFDLARHLEENLQRRKAAGASFFNAYGGSTSRNWSAFKAFATARVKGEQVDEIVISTRDTFQALYVWLDHEGSGERV